MQPRERLVVVSNRLPVTLRRTSDGWQTQHSAGGLATAMNPILKETGGVWIGWPGESGEDDPQRREVLAKLAEQDRAIAVDLPAGIAELYYEGYANQTLWPLFHHFPTLVSFSPESWRAYVAANERFRDAVVRHARPGDLIWVHDYHLMLLPRMLREALPEARIGFFLHIPFPSSEVFRILPRREELLEGLLGADLIGFHTHSHLQHFRSSLLRILGLENRFDRVETGGRAVRLEALPIGIAPVEFIEALRGEEAVAYRAELDRRFEGRRILLAVDRLDYTKGIPERLRTYRRLLDGASDLRGQVVLIQVAIPSRENISLYADLQREVNELVGQINGQFGTPDWTPVVYIRRGISRAQLVALYAAAELAWVTPLRDGMNLVAKEYVASKVHGAGGALVLSEFAGAAEEMGEAFAVNPYDEEQTAEVVRRVLALSEEERRERIRALHERVLRNNVFAWSERFLAALREAAEARERRPSDRPAPLDVAAVVGAYRDARRRALFLDYDGTLVSYAPRPNGAAPSKAVRDLLERLAADPANTVTLVSGRRSKDLEAWFGSVDGLWLVAEHGALVRALGSDHWTPLRPNADAGWKDRVRPVLQHFVDRTPGSQIEEKDYALVWHYRMAEPEFGEWLANELASMLESMLATTELRAARGRKVIEVMPAWANKGALVEYVLSAQQDADFRLAVGDDRTDEDMFARLDPDAWTIHVGGGSSRARFALPSAASVFALLERFAAVRRSGGAGSA